MSKEDFIDEIDFLGASLNIGFSGGFATTLTKNNEQVLDLMTDAIINPLLSEDEFDKEKKKLIEGLKACLLYTSPSPRDKRQSRMPSSA